MIYDVLYTTPTPAMLAEIAIAIQELDNARADYWPECDTETLTSQRLRDVVSQAIEGTGWRVHERYTKWNTLYKWFDVKLADPDYDGSYQYSRYSFVVNADTTASQAGARTLALLDKLTALKAGNRKRVVIDALAQRYRGEIKSYPVIQGRDAKPGDILRDERGYCIQIHSVSAGKGKIMFTRMLMEQYPMPLERLPKRAAELTYTVFTSAQFDKALRHYRVISYQYEQLRRKGM